MVSSPFLHSTVELGHTLWKNLVAPGDLVVDATCGRGFDTLFLAELVLHDSKGSVIGIDIQESAIESTKELLLEHLSAASIPNVELVNDCHSKLKEILAGRRPKLVVYNLGYLPGSDKKIKTAETTTLKSVTDALETLADNGCISLTCYPGHTEGATEEERLIAFSETLNPRLFRSLFMRFTNRSQAPSLLLIQKIPE